MEWKLCELCLTGYSWSCWTLCSHMHSLYYAYSLDDRPIKYTEVSNRELRLTGCNIAGLSSSGCLRGVYTLDLPQDSCGCFSSSQVWDFYRSLSLLLYNMPVLGHLWQHLYRHRNTSHTSPISTHSTHCNHGSIAMVIGPTSMMRGRG